MIPYTEPADRGRMMDDILGGRIAQVDRQWYWTEWHVAYAQSGMDTANNYVTREQAEAQWEKRLADLRVGWGHKGARFTETPQERPNGGKAIRFRSVLKNGKPGKLTGILYMDRIRRESPTKTS